MKKILFLYLDRKFPTRIETEDKINSSFPGITMRIFKSGDKRLFIKFIQEKKTTIKYIDASPSDLMNHFNMSKPMAENLLNLWVKERMKNQGE